MLKRFFLIVCGSFVGAFLAIVFVIFASIITSVAILGTMGNGTSTKSVEKNSILYINLEGEVTERAAIDMPFGSMLPFGSQGPSQSLATFKQALAKAEVNKNIKCIYLDCRGIAAAPATLFEMRKALIDFKKSDKPIYAYGDEGISEADYYLASVSDSIFLNPIGAVDIHGFGSQMPFFKGLLDKIGVEMQVIRVGEYKSAVEPYVLDHMSAANEEQIRHYLGNIWSCMSDSMANARNITPQRFNQMADSLVALLPADSLLDLKLVDHLCYRSDFEDKLRKLTNIDEDDELKLITPSDLVSDEDVIIDEGSDRIAILYATGEIDGSSSTISTDGIDSESLADEIRKLRLDKDVKGLVLRVNSPGGSAFGSEVIWKALEDFKASGKPFAVSMGDYAASGGYYISSGAQRIFAEPTTITGSIGVFGLIPNFENLTQNKLGVNFDEVTTNANGTFGSTMHPLTPFQRERLQAMVNNTYELFTSRCATGRNMPQDSIKAIGQGRVWDGISAKQLGLVDEFGGITEAVQWVAKKAGLKDNKYTVSAYPSADDSFIAMLEQMQQMKARQQLQQQMGLFYTCYREVQAIMARKQILCLMPSQEITY